MQPARSELRANSSPVIDSAPHQCPLCFKRYKRREHLQRHTSTHGPERPHQCTSCDRTFQRADVLKRHRRTCMGRTTKISRLPGRRRACDRCIRQKKACNSRRPCHRCLGRSAECCYSDSSALDEPPSEKRVMNPGDVMTNHAETATEDLMSSAAMMMPPPPPDPSLDTLDPSSWDASLMSNILSWAGPTWQDLLAMASECPPSAPGSHSLHFLDRFTSSTGLVQSFDCGNEHQRKQVWLALQRETCLCDSQQSESKVVQLPELPFDVLGQEENMNRCGFARAPSLGWLDDPLSLKTHQILRLIKDIVTVKPRNSSVTLDWSPGLQESCLHFFSPTNLRKYLGLYWAIWHPNVNFVHRPTFDPETAKPAVVATMAVIGKCHPSDHRTTLTQGRGLCIARQIGQR